MTILYLPVTAIRRSSYNFDLNNYIGQIQLKHNIMKPIKVLITLFVLIMMSLANYHDQSMASVDFFNKTQLVAHPDPICPVMKAATTGINEQTARNKSCENDEIESTGIEVTGQSGKTYNTGLVVM
jgi:hypothetical protein